MRALLESRRELDHVTKRHGLIEQAFAGAF
jgi:hypothetical protein